MKHEYHIIRCEQCGKEIRRYVEITKAFCSFQCKGIWQQTNLTQGKNPNYNKKWSDVKKQKQSLIIKERMDNPETKRKCGLSNKDKKFSKEKCKHLSETRMGHPRYFMMTDEIRTKIGIGSKKKFTKEYHKNMRVQMERAGKWIPLHEKNEYEIYRTLANWKSRMFDLPNIENIHLLTEHGIFNAETNKKGVVRDHMYSRHSGYDNTIFPEILRHPCNCRIITHSDNVKFARLKHNTDDHITLDILFKKILEFDGVWDEHELCVSLIEKYKNGQRFNIKKYIEQYE